MVWSFDKPPSGRLLFIGKKDLHPACKMKKCADIELSVHSFLFHFVFLTDLCYFFFFFIYARALTFFPFCEKYFMR